MNLKTTHFYYSKKLYSAFFIMLCLLSVPCFSQTTEDFEDETNSSKSFTNNGQTFTTVDSAETYDVNTSTSGLGWNGSTSDDVFLDNSDAVTVGGGTSLNIKSSDGTDFLIKSFYLYIAQFNATQNPTSLNVTILGKKDGNNVFTFTKTSGFSDIPSGSPNNGFTLIDFSSEGGSDNTNSSIDEIIITTTGNADYLALDGFRWDVIPCADPDIPTVTATTTTICEGGNTNLNITGNLNDATNWHIYTGSCGGTAIGTTATGTFNVSPTTTTTYYIRGEGDCVTPGSCSTVTVNVTNLIDASFNYNASTYCKNGSDPTPTITEYGGIFTTSPAGIAMNITTGKINLTTSQPGTYTMTYTTTNGSCSNATSTTITINDLDDASINYTKIAYCDWVSDPTPIVTTPGGTFSAPNGLDINTATGKIDLSESTHGTYTVTYTTNGPCPNSATTSVRINPLDDPSFAYSSIAFCNNAPDQSPIAIATPGGWFSSTNGLVITSNGTIDVSASTPGNYVITYTTNGNCMNSAIAPITIRASDDASFSYGAAAYCSNASDPSPTITGLTGGSFSSTPGLVIASNGTIDVSASTPGTYSITYTTAGTCPNSSTTSVTINALDDASFSYASATYCSNNPSPFPNSIATPGGTFSSSGGLSIDSTTGRINTYASAPGTHTVTYTTAGNCPNSATTSVTMNTAEDASFAYPAYAYCLDAPDPSPSAIASPGGTFSSTPGLAIAANGTIDVSASTPGTYTVTYTKTGTCPNSARVYITINALDDASFSYPASAYCVDASDPSPNSIATPGGTFSSTNGLVIALNGTIDVSASTPGTYSITYTTAGTCPNSASANLTINALDDASFSYGAAAYCSNAADPSPTITGLTGGSFSSTPGLVIASNGTIDVSASTPNTYTVTYTTAGACPNSSTTSVTINALDDPSFTYGTTAICVNSPNKAPTIVNSPGGTFSSTPGLSIDANGLIKVSESTPGTYRITYTTNDNCPNSAGLFMTINALDDASFSYGASSYTTEDADPSPTITGLTGGTFSAAGGLDINASTGVIDISASTPGSYVVTYTTAGTCPNSSTFNIDIHYNTYTWTGNTDNNWNNTSNWNNNMVPHSGGNVTIPNGITNYPTATSGITVNSITLNDGASFIAQAAVNGSITYNRNLPTTNWHLVSAPVSGETLDDVIANNDLDSGTGGNLGLGYYLNNTGPAWIYARASSNIGIANGLGISIKLANPGNLSISGNMNTSNIIIPITVGTRTSFNLLGNPFISYVNSATFTSNNSGALTEETLWLWDGSQYVTYNAASPIELAPGQGFFVEASGNNNVTFETSNQSHQTTDTFMRGSGASHTTFEIFVDSKEEKNSTKVFYINGKTTDFDNGYDSKMFSEDTSDLKIFTELITNNKGKKLAIQTLPNSGFENMVVPVGLQAKAGKSIEISVKGTNFPEGINVYLEDRINNVFTNLSEENYTITLDKDANGIGQFYIHTSSERLSTDSVNQLLENVSIYRSSKNQLTIAGLQSEKASLSLYSILGKKITTKKFRTNGISIITLPEIASGVYVVELSSELGKVSKKIIVQ